MAGRRVKKGPYIRMYCGYWQDWRVLSLSLDAETVWLRSIAYSKDNKLDGFMPESALLVLFPKITTAPSVLTTELIEAGLWAESGIATGWDIRHFNAYQTTVDEDEAAREANRERQARFRANRNGHHEEENHEPR